MIGITHTLRCVATTLIALSLAAIFANPALADFPGPVYPFLPNGNYGAINLIGSVSSNIPIPGGANSTIFIVTNLGATIAYTTLGTSNAVTANTTVDPIQPGANRCFSRGAYTYIAGYSTNSETLTIVGGTGQCQDTSGAPATGSATAANQTNGSQLTMIVDGLGNVIGSTANALNVDCIAGCSGGGGGGGGAVTAALGSYAAGFSPDIGNSATPTAAWIGSGTPTVLGTNQGIYNQLVALNTAFNASLTPNAALTSWQTSPNAGFGILCQYLSANPSAPANTNTIGLRCDPNGLLKIAPTASTNGGALNSASFIITNNTTAVVVRNAPATLYSISAYTSTAATEGVWLKLYDTATTFTCGTGTPVRRDAVPAASTPANLSGATIDLGPAGRYFTTGITACVTVNVADSDATAPPAANYGAANFVIQ